MTRADTLERLVPEGVASDDVTGQETFKLHAERYYFAARHARPGRLVDIACGVGYGTRILVEERADVEAAVGVDLSSDAIEYARNRYAHRRVSYEVGDAMRFASDVPFDTAVSLETIEHLPDPEAFLTNLLRSLRPGGRLIASVPTTPSVDANPHHRHDFTERSFRRMFTSRGLQEVACQRQVQPFNPFRVIGRKEKRLSDLRPNLKRYYLTHPGAAWKRAASTILHGFTNRYITIAWEKGGSA